ncbi:MAG: NAD(P)H-hydrate dehydratase [Candidatus Hydrogenedentota bacterium]
MFFRGVNMKIVNQEQMKEIDRKTIEEIKIPSLILMENAANNTVLAAEEMLGNLNRKKIGIFCGTGNNGGDGMAVSRILLTRKAEPYIYIIGDIDKITDDAKIQFEIIKNLEIPFVNIKDKADLIKSKNNWDLVIDAILGTGSKGELRGIYRDTVIWLNSLNKPILSIDIPTGVEPDTGKVYTDAIRATRTITFGLPKIGNVFYPGTVFTGALNVVDIGFPSKFLQDENIKLNLLLLEEVRNLLPSYPENISKDNRGRTLIIGGGQGMAGAVVLAAQAALKIGAGVVYTYTGKGSHKIVANNSIESVNFECEEDYLTNKDVEKIKGIAVRCKSVAIGPGLSLEPQTKNAFFRILKEVKTKFVIDADGINILKDNIEILNEIPYSILTPHLKEFARLTDINEKEILTNALSIGEEFAKKWNIILLLKGFRSIIFLPDTQKFILPVGNISLATAGSGDVLTGIICGLLAMTENPMKSALAGSFIHGFIGDMLKAEIGDTGATSIDILKNIPLAIKKIKV